MTPRVRQYADEIAFWHGTTPAAIFGRKRDNAVAVARGDVMRRLRSDGFGTVQIGRWLGRDHSTVSYWTNDRVRATKLGATA